MEHISINNTLYPLPYISPMKESPSSNERNSNIAAQCAPTWQSIPTVEKGQNQRIQKIIQDIKTTWMLHNSCKYRH